MAKLIGLNKIKTAVFISGTGSNLKKLINFSKTKKSPISINLIKNKLLNSCANITGGGLEDNIKRVIPDGLSADIDLDKIKTKKIFKWLKQNNINDKEMLKTFNCGVGFCLIIKPQNLKKISKFFSKEFEPYVIGKITLGKKKIKLNGKIDWS